MTFYALKLYFTGLSKLSKRQLLRILEDFRKDLIDRNNLPCSRLKHFLTEQQRS